MNALAWVMVHGQAVAVWPGGGVIMASASTSGLVVGFPITLLVVGPIAAVVVLGPFAAALVIVRDRAFRILGYVACAELALIGFAGNHLWGEALC